MLSQPTLYNMMNHPCYLTLTRFIDASGFKISRASVIEAQKQIEGEFDLIKFHQLLSVFFNDLLVIQIDSHIDNHDLIITPSLLLKTEGNQVLMFVVLKIDNETVTIFEYEKKDFTISKEEFQTLLKGSIIILKEEETYIPSPEILEKYNKEQQEDKEYIESIEVIDDFISTEDCQKIIDFSEENNLFFRSKVGKSTDAIVSNLRTSSSAFIESHDTTPIIVNLKEKIAKLLNCNLDKIESLQGVRYYKSESYKPHFDAYSKKRNRTCLLYLNDNFSGGDTYFPEVNVAIKPKTGRLLVFKNLDANDRLITQSFHQGSPVDEGVKYACNIWIKS